MLKRTRKDKNIMNTINNAPFFPSTYHYNLQDLRFKSRSDTDYQSLATYLKHINIYNSRLFITMIIAAIVLVLCLAIYFMIKKRKVSPHVKNATWMSTFALGFISSVALLISTICYIEVPNDVEIDSYFKLKQTNFYIKPQDQHLKVTRVNPLNLTITPENNQTTSKYYNIYLYVTNKHDKNYYDNFYIGAYKQHQVQLYQFDPARSSSRSQIVRSLVTYTNYIKKHHLEKDFANNAQLVLDGAYLNCNQDPQTIMYGKNNHVLRYKDDNNQLVTISTNE